MFVIRERLYAHPVGFLQLFVLVYKCIQTASVST